MQLQVYLLKPGSLAQEHFEKLVNLLEQFVYTHKEVIISIVGTCFDFLFYLFVLVFVVVDTTTPQMVADGPIH